MPTKSWLTAEGHEEDRRSIKENRDNEEIRAQVVGRIEERWLSRLVASPQSWGQATQGK